MILADGSRLPDDLLERGCSDGAVYRSAGDVLTLSMAISLKRIADALAAPDAAGALNIRDLLSGIEMNGRCA